MAGVVAVSQLNAHERGALLLAGTGILSATVAHAGMYEDSASWLPFGVGAMLVAAALAAERRRVHPLAAVAVAALILLVSAPSLASLVHVAIAVFFTLRLPRPQAWTVGAAFALWTPALRLFGPDPWAGSFPLALALAASVAYGACVGAAVRGRDATAGLLAVALASVVVERHRVVASAGLAPDDLAVIAAAMLALAVLVVPVVRPARARSAARPAAARTVVWPAIALCSIGYAAVALALILGKPYHVDAVAIVHRAAEAVVRGEHPYVVTNAEATLASFGLGPDFLTHREDGSALQSLNYPALAVLVPAPFVALGLADLRVLYAAQVLAAIAIVAWAARPAAYAVAAIVGNLVIARQNVLAGIDPLWAVLTLGAYATFQRPLLSAGLLGLACASRQPAWFFVPVYLVAVWRIGGRQEVLRRGGVVVAGALLPNLPYLVTAPAAFLGGLAAPMVEPLEPYGVGLVRIGMDGVISLLPRGVHTVLAALALLLVLVTVARTRRPVPLSAALAVVPLYVAWRSLQNYFAWTAILPLVVRDEEEPTPTSTRSSSG